MNEFDCFSEDLGLAKHNLDTDTIKLYATNSVPNAAAHAVKADLTEIASGNGYPAGGSDVTGVWSRSGDTTTFSATAITWTATGAGFGPFAYVVLYNDTATGDPLIGWFDPGKQLTIPGGGTFTFNPTTGLFTVAPA